MFQKIALPSDFMHKFQNNLFEVWFYTIFFYDLINVYSPGAGADNPLGTKFWCQQEQLVTSVICCKFKKKSLWSMNLYNCFHDFIRVYSPAAGADSPREQSFDVNKKALSLYPFVASFKNISLKYFVLLVLGFYGLVNNEVTLSWSVNTVNSFLVRTIKK